MADPRRIAAALMGRPPQDAMMSNEAPEQEGGPGDVMEKLSGMPAEQLVQLIAALASSDPTIAEKIDQVLGSGEPEPQSMPMPAMGA